VEQISSKILIGAPKIVYLSYEHDKDFETLFENQVMLQCP